ncbi:MAG: hypothetical protein U1F51_07925 [Burkholderiales bacterium]
MPRPSTCASSPSTENVIARPQPPRHWPGPPESGRSAYSWIRMRALASTLSSGLLARFAVLLSRPSTPSAPNRAPIPPTIGSTTMTLRRPEPASVSARTTGMITPPLQAGMNSGSACASAPLSTSRILPVDA